MENLTKKEAKRVIKFLEGKGKLPQELLTRAINVWETTGHGFMYDWLQTIVEAEDNLEKFAK